MCSNGSDRQISASLELQPNLLQGTTDTYTRIEKLQRRFLVATAGTGPLTAKSFDPVVDGTSIDLTPVLRFREAALEVLVRYTEILKGLAQEDFEAEVNQASEQLAVSLRSLGSTAAPDNAIADQASGVLATIADTVGRIIVEKKRLDALKEVMDMAQPALDKLTPLIEQSNEKIKQLVTLMFDRILAHRNTSRPAFDDPRRIEFDTKVADETAEVKAILASLDGLNNGIRSIPGAHKEIRSMLDEKPGVSKEALQQLIQEGQRINKFYRSVK